MARIVAIGASQGGVHALRTIVSALLKTFPLPILVAQHVGTEQSMLPSILATAGPLAATHAVTGETIQAGHVYIAPPDRHLIVVDGRLELTHGPRENWVRPAIDPLFRSVAETYGPDAIGVVLTGRLNDGTSGLFEIKRRGGIAIVQDPRTCEAPSMPVSALENVAVDYCLSLQDIAPMLVRLAKEAEKASPKEERQELAVKTETNVQRPIAQTCPECGGAMAQEILGTLTRFRCHIGHVMTAEVLAAAQLERLEADLAAVLRFLNERTNLCREMAEKHFEAGNVGAGHLWQRAAEEAEMREHTAKQLNEADWLHPEEAPPALEDEAARRPVAPAMRRGGNGSDDEP